jgi:hypothetical protein
MLKNSIPRKFISYMSSTAPTGQEDISLKSSVFDESRSQENNAIKAATAIKSPTDLKTNDFNSYLDHFDLLINFDDIDLKRNNNVRPKSMSNLFDN